MDEMLEQIRSLGDQLRWAADLEPPHLGTFSDVLVAGMGGSGIAGDYAKAIAEPRGTRITVHKGYGPVPAWANRARPLVIATSYSGNTEETLNFAVAAHEAGLSVAAITTGGRLATLASDRNWPILEVPEGYQPRAAVGQMVGAVLGLLQGAYALDDQRHSITEAANLADSALEEGSRRWEEAEAIAAKLSERITIVYGGGPISATVAQRWKTQINENAKMPAWWSVLPELDHNEITGWETMPELTRQHLGVVALSDRDDHDRIGPRLKHTKSLTEEAVPWVGHVVADGSSLLARLVSLTVVGDLVSWMLARNAGVDPVPVETIEGLKKLLAEEGDE